MGNVNNIVQGPTSVQVSPSFVNVAIAGSNVGSFSSTGLQVIGTNSLVNAQATGGYSAFIANASGTNASYVIFNNATNGEQSRISGQDGNILTFQTGNAILSTERLRIDNLGNILVGAQQAYPYAYLSIGHTTVATSTSTGALQVTGGAGIQGNLYVGSGAGNSIVATGNITNTGNITTSGNLYVGANIFTTGNITTNTAANVVTGNVFVSNVYAASYIITPRIVNSGVTNVTVVGTQIGANVYTSYVLASGNVQAAYFQGTSTTALYADLAENYTADGEYEPGTVVVFGGDQEITVTTEFADTRVAGAISTQPAYHMNFAMVGLAVALRGRVPCKVVGPVVKGDCLVTSNTAGYCESVGTGVNYGPAIFAKSLETNLDPGSKVITAVIL